MPNLCVIEIPEEEAEKGTENVFDKIMAKSIPNLKRMKQIIQGLGAQSVPNKMNLNRFKPRHIKLKWQKLERGF